MVEQQYRRKTIRKNFTTPVGALFHGKMILTSSFQIGDGGALIQSTAHLKEIQKDQKLVITFFLPDIGGLVATARCVYVLDEGKIGLQFLELDSRYKQRVRELVSRC